VTGVSELEHQRDAAEVTASARERGAHPHHVDGSGVTGKADALAAVAAALSFPDYFGANLDALFDCLRDLAWLPTGEHVLVWSRPDVLRAADPAAYAGIADTLADAVTATVGHERVLRVVLTDR
jgi:Barstar (barnase inhibitor)